MTTVWLKYVWKQNTRVSGIKKLDWTLPEQWEKLHIEPWDIFQKFSSEAEWLMRSYKGYFVIIEKEDSKKEEVLQKIKLFRWKLWVNEEYSCRAKKWYITDWLCNELSKLYWWLHKIIEKLWTPNYVFSMWWREVPVNIYELSTGKCQNQILFCPTIEKCMQDVDIIIWKLESMSWEEFNQMLRESSEKEIKHTIYAQWDVLIHSDKKEYKNEWWVQNINAWNWEQNIEKQKNVIDNKQWQKDSWQDDVRLYILVGVMIFIAWAFVVKYIWL